MVSSYSTKAIATGIKIFDESKSVAVLLRGVRKDNVARCMVLAEPDTLVATQYIKTELQITGAKNLQVGEYTQFHIYGADFEAQLTYADDKLNIVNGERINAAFFLRFSPALGIRSKFSLRHGQEIFADSTVTNVAHERLPRASVLDSLPFLMPIQDVFNIKGRGIAVTGNIERGTVHRGDAVEIVGLSRPSIKTFVSEIDMMSVNSVGLFFKEVEREDLERGMVVAVPDSIQAHQKFKANFIFTNRHHLPDATPEFFTQNKFYLHIQEIPLGCKLYIVEEFEAAKAGMTIAFAVETREPIAVEIGTYFTLNQGGKHMIASGFVIEILE